jgi:hypothetical protein
MTGASTTGFAIKVDGKLLVHTVSHHARGAKVNWLWTDEGVRVMANWTDALIEKAWLYHSKNCTTAECVEISLTETGGQ